MFRHGLSALGSPRLHRLCLSTLPGWRTVVVAPGIRVLNISPASSSFSSSVLWFFSPSLHRRYSGFFATTASDDFSSTLMEEISPGKVQNLSSRAVWLYLMRLDDLWASLLPASLPPASGLTATFCTYGRKFAFRFFQFHLAATPCGSATVAVIGSGWLLSSNKILPMLGTLARPVQAAEPRFVAALLSSAVRCCRMCRL